MDEEAKLFGLMAIAEEQQKAVTLAIKRLETLQSDVKNAVRESVKENIASVGDGAKNAITEALEPVTKDAKNVSKKLTDVLSKFTFNWHLTCGLSALGLVFGGVLVTYFIVWYERGELEKLQQERVELQTTIGQMEKLTNGVKIAKCGKEELPCVQIDTKAGQFSDDYYVLKGFKRN